jgi:Protein of unknown function (DUF2442)
MTLSDEIITAVSVPRHGVLELTFADGTHGEVEVIQRMWGPVFTEARTPEGFAAVTVDHELGTVVWPGGADLAPDTLYLRVKTGVWPSLDPSTA